MNYEKINLLRNYFNTGTTKSYDFRYKQLTQLKDALHKHKKEIIRALHEDLKKPRFESMAGEFDLIVEEISFAQKNLKAWMQQETVHTLWRLFPAKSATVFEPYGVTLIIAPWNYPIQTSLLPLIGSIAAGNCTIIKPSEFAPASAQLLDNLIAHTFDSSYITVMQGNAPQTEKLLTYKYDYIFFTGSPRIGKKIMEAAAQHITPLTLELGGKSPCVVTESAPIACAAKRIAWAKFFNVGQNCTSPDYLLVHQSIKKDLLSRLTKEIEKMFSKNPQHSADYGRIINTAHHERLVSLMENTSIIYGGTHDKEDRYIAPTIIDEPNTNAAVMQEEIFGPLLPVLSYETFDDAIATINAKPKPLVIYIFEKNKKRIQTLINQTSSGTVVANDLLIQAVNPHLPFGGVGMSGFGTYHGKKSFEAFSHLKSLFYGSCRFDLSFRYPPHEKKS